MSSNNNSNYDEDNLVDYEPEEEEEKQESNQNKVEKKGHVAIHSSGFRDFLLKPEILRAVVDCGFEHPSEVQHECVPQAILGMDVLCQAKSGMGKTAVFVIAVLQQLEPKPGECQCLVLCHTRELAYQICNEFNRFSKYIPEVKTKVFYGGINIKVHKEELQNEVPSVVVGTPGRILQLVKEKSLDLSKIRHFILDECDKMLESLDMRSDVQQIFKSTPHSKQVMMFSATLSKDIRPVAKKFMSNPMEIYVDNESKLTLHGLQQYTVKLKEEEKNRKLMELLDALEFNQVVIFVRSVKRATALDKLLQDCYFPSICIHRALDQDERIKRYQSFKNFDKRILVSTDIFGRGIDIERVNIVINYDMPDNADQYLHRVGRAGRFGTKGLAISFIAPDAPIGVYSGKTKYIREKKDEEVMEDVQKRFTVKVSPLPEKIDPSSYMTN